MKRLVARASSFAFSISAVAETVIMTTSMGKVVIELDEKKAPITVKNFLTYVDKKHYDGTTFHRVVPNFMIQGGEFKLTDGMNTQKEPLAPIKNEANNGLKNLRGTIAMACTSDPNSATCQFFINVKDNPALNFPNNGGRYAVFGKVTKGMKIVDKIKAVKTDRKFLISRGPDGSYAPNKAGDVIPVIADGGIRYSGNITKAITAGASCVMILGLFAGLAESPERTILYHGRTFKVYRGMGSLGAMAKGSSERHRQSDKGPGKLVPEGVEGRVLFITYSVSVQYLLRPAVVCTE